MAGDTSSVIVRALVVFGPTFASFLLHAGVEFLRPGKRGKFNVERTHFYADMDPATLKRYITERLTKEKFRILKETDPLVLEAIRQVPRPKDSMMDPYPYPKLQLKVRVELLPHSHGVQARMIVGNMSYIVRETGELNYMEAFLDFLMGKSTFRDVPPDINSNAMSSIYMGICTIITPWLLFLFGFDGIEFTKVAAIVTVPIIMTCIQAIHGMIQMGTKPTQTYGYKYAVVGIGLAVIAAVSTVGAIFAHDML